MSMAMANSRKSRGRQRIEMAKMEKESNLQVTFSKRRSGLFKKASELSTLCGAETAIVVFSPGKKVYSFGHPSVETVVDRFLTRNPLPIGGGGGGGDGGRMQLSEARRSANIRELNMQLTKIVSELEAEKNRGELLEKMKKESQGECWWAGPVEELGLEQLQQLMRSLEQLRAIVMKLVDDLILRQPPNFPSGLLLTNISDHDPHDLLFN